MEELASELNYWKLENMQVQIEALSSRPLIPSIFKVSIVLLYFCGFFFCEEGKWYKLMYELESVVYFFREKL